MAQTNKPILELQGVTMKFGNLVANENVSFTIYENQIVSLIGPNGAGKTTLFNCTTGFYKPAEGKVIYFSEEHPEGRDIAGVPSYKICNMGITRTFQIVKTLQEMTVKENIMTGAFLRHKSRKDAARKADEILEATGLKEKQDMLGGSLTIVDKKRVEIARALATEPRILMLDECMAGLNQTEIKEVMKLCTDLKAQGITLLIVEHIMEAIMPISDNIVVLNAGKKIAEGKPKDIAENEEVIKAYLGDKYNAKSKKS